ncbi:MAG: L-2-hydroxyglutarate oxidase [Actinobacteria bacterium]|nr:L-2-hydroxyglutarate oxidase [Actinomycetota bacterium]
MTTNTQSSRVDLVVVGGGIVGLATAYSVLLQSPSKKVVVLEKESTFGAHQSGHNSGVIHSGLYYKPGSQKAKNCLDGYSRILKFCVDFDVPYEVCGKIVVATSENELGQLEALRQRGEQNGLTGIRRLSSGEIKEIEPHCAGVAGLFVKQTGIVDYSVMANRLVEQIKSLGGQVLTGQKVSEIIDSAHSTIVSTSALEFSAKSVVTCGGLFSDRLAMLTESKLDLRIVPFRGEYFELKASATHLVRNLIYPVPDPNFPFLGVHFTRRIDGSIECGPNAVLAFAREGYRKSDISIRDFTQTLAWPGFQKVARKYWRTGLGEYHRSFSKSAFVKALQKLVPDITTADLEPAGAGVRAQACSRDGGLLDDFEIRQFGRVIHVCNAPSPAATASLAIGQAIASRVAVIG